MPLPSGPTPRRYHLRAPHRLTHRHPRSSNTALRSPLFPCRTEGRRGPEQAKTVPALPLNRAYTGFAARALGWFLSSPHDFSSMGICRASFLWGLLTSVGGTARRERLPRRSGVLRLHSLVGLVPFWDGRGWARCPRFGVPCVLLRGRSRTGGACESGRARWPVAERVRSVGIVLVR